MTEEEEAEKEKEEEKEDGRKRMELLIRCYMYIVGQRPLTRLGRGSLALGWIQHKAQEEVFLIKHTSGWAYGM